MSGKTKNHIARRDFLAVSLGGLAATSLSPLMCGSAAAERSRPNVIFAFSDEHRWHSTSFTDMPAVRTPVMQTMASQGVQFTHCFSNYPVCSPYRAMVMSGRWPYQNGVIDNGLPLDATGQTLGKAFRDAGYDTAYIGKWHLGGNHAESFGFDHSMIWTGTNKHWDESAYHPREGEPVCPKGYNATLMTDQALTFIEKRREKPFFLMLSWNPPHSNFLDAPPEKKALYPEGSLPRRSNASPEQANAAGQEPRAWSKSDWPSYQGYHAHISAIDDELGRVLSRLKELGLDDNTIVVYTSDHGSMMGSHGLGGKRQPYEESIRVPFLIRWPGVIPAGQKVDALFGAIDIFPTLCGIAGVAPGGSCSGSDYSPWLRGQKGPDPDAQFLMHICKKGASGGENHPVPLFRGVRTRRYTYAVGPERPLFLYDDIEDPFQMTNLVDDASKADTRKEMTDLLRHFLRKAEDPFELAKG